MSRRKTRVTRTSRRKARSGTRKQKGGFWGILTKLFRKNPETNTGATGAAGAPAAPPPGGAPPAAAQTGGARKTCHRHRHHHRHRK